MSKKYIHKNTEEDVRRSSSSSNNTVLYDDGKNYDDDYYYNSNNDRGDSCYIFLLVVSGVVFLLSRFVLLDNTVFSLQNITIYKIPQSLSTMGDKILRYQFLRLYYDYLLVYYGSSSLVKQKRQQ